jgi:hypothetical protein
MLYIFIVIHIADPMLITIGVYVLSYLPISSTDLYYLYSKCENVLDILIIGKKTRSQYGQKRHNRWSKLR